MLFSLSWLTAMTNEVYDSDRQQVSRGHSTPQAGSAKTRHDSSVLVLHKKGEWKKAADRLVQILS